jgi:SSS family solute:Na+ symporter
VCSGSLRCRRADSIYTLNLLVAVVVTLALRAAGTPEGPDATEPADYHADEGSARVEPVADVLHSPAGG